MVPVNLISTPNNVKIENSATMEFSGTSLQDEFARFLSWWVGELNSLIPESARSFFKRKSSSLLVDVLDNEIRIGRFRGETYDTLEQFNLSDINNPKANNTVDPKKLLGAHKHGSGHVTFRLPRSRAMVRTLTGRPQAMESNLDEALFFELERLTPFLPEEIWYDFHVCGRDQEAGTIDIQIAMIPKTTTDELLSLANSWGLDVERLDLVDETFSSFNVNFLKRTQRILPSKLEPINRILRLVAFGLFLLVVIFPLLNQFKTITHLSEIKGLEMAQANEAITIQNQIDAIIAENHFLAEAKKFRPPFVVILEELTRILPDDTWLVRMQLNGSEVKITGYSRAASKLIEVINNSHIFQDVKPASSFVRDAKLDRERFKMTFTVNSSDGGQG
ncbi:MAG: PilN domain-containing protein [Magnetococcales bacterium]|nr:PilN domain-containing protein [Magnetococcales bacterium]